MEGVVDVPFEEMNRIAEELSGTPRQYPGGQEGISPIEDSVPRPGDVAGKSPADGRGDGERPRENG